MNPKNRIEKAVALEAIADAADKLKNEGTSDIEVRQFIIGARNKLSEERPDPEKYAKATTMAARWAKQNM